jgi:hypothetical protein
MTSDVLVPGISMGTMHLGARYGETMQSAMYGRLLPHLHEGVRILDVGGGRNPFLPPEMRPARARYVGTDVDAGELQSHTSTPRRQRRIVIAPERLAPGPQMAEVLAREP